MLRIFPSQVVEYIQTCINKSWHQGGDFQMGPEGAVGIVAGLLELIERVPDDLITLGPEDLATPRNGNGRACYLRSLSSVRS